MVLEKGDSGVCLATTEPSSPTEAAGVARPISFFVNVGGLAETAPGAHGAAVRKTPLTSSASVTTTPQDLGLKRTSGQSTSRSTTTPRTLSGKTGRLQGDGTASIGRSTGRRFRTPPQKLFTKVRSYMFVNTSSFFLYCQHTLTQHRTRLLQEYKLPM